MEMKSYCGNEKDKEEYVRYLNECIKASNKAKIPCKGYTDPDETYRTERYPNRKKEYPDGDFYVNN